MESYQSIKKEFISDLTRFLIWKIKDEFTYDERVYYSDANSEERRKVNYYLGLYLLENDNDKNQIPYKGIVYPPYLEKNIELIRLIANKMFSNWLYKNYNEYSLNTESPEDTIQQMCNNLLIEWWDKYFSCILDIKELSNQNQEINYGKIKWFDQYKGFGVIEKEKIAYIINGSDILCDQKSLSAGKLVKFQIRNMKNNNFNEAFNVKIASLEKFVRWKDITQSQVVGFHRSFSEEIVSKLSLGEQLSLRREPVNTNDANTISVATKSGQIIGHLEKLLPSMDASWLNRLGGSIPAWVSENKVIANHSGIKRVLYVLHPISDYKEYDEIQTFESHSKKILDSENSRGNQISKNTDKTNYWYSKYQTSPSQNKIGDDELITKVVGVTYEGRQSVVAQLQVGETVLLKREPTNIYDHNAIMVIRSNGQQIGYISRILAARLANKFDLYGQPVEATVTELTGRYYSGSNLGACIRFNIPDIQNIGY